MANAYREIVVIGAGIVGLDVALVLAERGFGSRITVVAEYLPGDTAPEYTSPWAGCNFSAISGSDANALKWDRGGYLHLSRLATEKAEQSFVLRTPSIEFWDEDVPHHKIHTMSEYLEDFQVISAEKLPQGAKFGVSFTTLTVNAPKHIEYLYKILKDQYNVSFDRRKLQSIEAAFCSPSTKIIFNCIGNAARTVSGVQDAACYPTRGQVLLAKASKVRTNVMRHGKDYETYVIPRPLSNGNVILGGFMQKGNGDVATYSHDAQDIIRRTTQLSPELGENDFEVIAAFAGLRPSRTGGARIERDTVTVSGAQRPIIHNYDAGGTGFQAGYGMAIEAVDLAADILQELQEGPCARL